MRAIPRSRFKLDSLKTAAVLLPPLAVKWVGRADLIPLSICLTALLWIPGVVHAWHLVAKTQADREQQFVAAFRSHIGHLR
jgi:uncharacterized membrane protein YqaE (UPF0057 family)